MPIDSAVFEFLQKPIEPEIREARTEREQKRTAASYSREADLAHWDRVWQRLIEQGVVWTDEEWAARRARRACSLGWLDRRGNE